MGNKQEKRTESLVRIRLTKSEKRLLETEYRAAFHATFSDFIRHKLLAKDISKAHRKKYEAFIKIGSLREELNAVGVNINQVTKRMHTYQDYEATPKDREMLSKLLVMLEGINKVLDDI